MLKKRNIIFFGLLILGVFLITGCFLISTSTYTVTFNSQGGSVVNSQTVESSGLATEPTDTTKIGYAFGGWYKEPECTNAWDFNSDMVTADVTLYGKWTPLYALRDTGPAGGLIFYVKEGGYSEGWMYLEATPNDQSDSQVWSNITDVAVGTSAQGIEIGTGQANTTAIIAQSGHTESAAQLCGNLTEGGYSDWCLPSKNELNLMYTNLKVAGVGGFESAHYWSSSENNAYYVWIQYFASGNQSKIYKYVSQRVRAVRAF